MNYRSIELNNHKKSDSFLSFFEELQQTCSLESCWSLYCDEVEKYGIKHVFYGFSVNHHNNDQLNLIPLYFSNFTSDFMQYYEMRASSEYDFSVQWCSNTDQILQWNSGKKISNLTSKQLQFEHESFEFGVTNGLSIPLWLGHKGNRGGIGLSATDVGFKEFDQIYQEYQTTLYQITMLFHQYVQFYPLFSQKLSEHDRIVSLSVNEKTCLLFLSNGCQISEIAEKMNRGHRTVELYLNSARHKLKTRTTTQAVCKAMTLGLITS